MGTLHSRAHPRNKLHDSRQRTLTWWPRPVCTRTIVHCLGTDVVGMQTSQIERTVTRKGHPLHTDDSGLPAQCLADRLGTVGSFRQRFGVDPHRRVVGREDGSMTSGPTPPILQSNEGSIPGFPGGLPVRRNCAKKGSAAPWFYLLGAETKTKEVKKMKR